MSEIVANPITNSTLALPQSMALNPVFDQQVILGLPLWFFVDAFLVLVAITVLLYWMFRMKRLASVRGYVDVQKKASPFDEMVWSINSTRRLSIELFKNIDGVLGYPDETVLLKYVHNDNIPPLTVGNVGGILCSESYYLTRDMVSEMARDTACEEYNRAVETIENSTGPITNHPDYVKFGRKNLEVLYPDGIVMDGYRQFDPEEDSKYKPVGMSARLNGGILKRETDRLLIGQKEESLWLKLAVPGAIIMVIGIGIIAAWFAPV